MVFVVTHFTKNLGTTDYLLQHLDREQLAYYFLRHPFPESGLEHSEFFKGGKGQRQLISQFRANHSFLIDMLRSSLLSNYLLFKHRKDITNVIGFGSINAFSILLIGRILRKRVIFWGVDYSRQRFGNKILNKFYLWFEDMNCRYASLVVQPNLQQEEARIKWHKLKKEKSIIIPNGVNISEFQGGEWSAKRDIGFVYVGAITPQHGIAKFIQHQYVERNTKYPLHIFGGGPDLKAIQELVSTKKLQNKITIYGPKDPLEIAKLIDSLPLRLIGIAPYVMTELDHVAYIDSLKVKEYTALGLPYIASDVMTIDDMLKPYGFRYNSDEVLDNIIDTEIQTFNFDREQQQAAIQQFSWAALLGRFTKNYLQEENTH